MEEPVRSQARLDQTKRLSNAILRRTVVNVVLFIVVYLVLFAGFMTTLGSAVSNFVYELLGYDYALHTLASNLFLVLTAIGFVAGIVLVVRSGINRALRYFDLLLDSVSDILAKSDGPVMLPGELAPTAMALNTIKATSEQNERAAKAAEDRKNELVVYLAHDIKTPLTSIIGYLTLLEESPDLPLEVRERYTGITLDKAYRLEELLDEFFEITRYNLQTIPIERSRFDAALFVNQVVDEFFPPGRGAAPEPRVRGPRRAVRVRRRGARGPRAEQRHQERGGPRRPGHGREGAHGARDGRRRLRVVGAHGERPGTRAVAAAPRTHLREVLPRRRVARVGSGRRRAGAGHLP